MSKSKSDLLLVLALALVGGCDALRTPVPEDPPTPIRASFTGFVGKGIPTNLFFARPIDELSEQNLFLPWIDQDGSGIEVDRVVGTGLVRSSTSGIYPLDGLRGDAYVRLPSDTAVYRLRGCLRWNASTPYTVSDEGMVSDSFDLRPQPSTRVRFLRDGVRGELCLRWPRLAAAGSSDLDRWSSIPDSLIAFRNDWIALSKGRGDSKARILLLDTTSHPYAYRWNDPDTSVLGRILGGETAQTIFSVGDSIWIPTGRSAALWLNLDTTDTLPVLRDVSIWSTSTSKGFQAPSASNGTDLTWGAYSPMGFSLSDGGDWRTYSNPVRVVIQITGTCPAFADWRRYGSTDRWHRPTGNVAPFDGYLCEIFPDTISFPRGDVVLSTPDTSTNGGSVVMLSKTVKTELVNP